MASVSRRLLRRETIPCFSHTVRKLFSTVGSPSFAQRLRDLPKDFPSTNAKRDASLVKERTKKKPFFLLSIYKIAIWVVANFSSFF